MNKRVEQMQKSYNEVLNGTATIHRNAKGQIHHDTKPAIITSIRQEWYENGLPHRDDGPAIMCLDTHVVDFWEHGKYIKTFKVNDDAMFDAWLYKGE
jgi:hypothetical protein